MENHDSFGVFYGKKMWISHTGLTTHFLGGDNVGFSVGDHGDSPLGIYGDFHRHGGYPNSWMIWIMDNPILSMGMIVMGVPLVNSGNLPNGGYPGYLDPSK